MVKLYKILLFAVILGIFFIFTQYTRGIFKDDTIYSEIICLMVYVFFCFAIHYFIFSKKFLPKRTILFSWFLFWWMPFSQILMMIIIKKYDFGDLQTYYFLPKYYIETGTLPLEPFESGLALVHINFLIFNILPISISGLFAIGAYIAFMGTIFISYPMLKSEKISIKLLFFAYGFPSLILWSTYQGKDVWMLLGIGIIYFLLDNIEKNQISRRKNILFLLLIFFLCFQLRVYQGLIIGTAFFLSFLFPIYFSKLLLVFVGMGISAPLAIDYISKKLASIFSFSGETNILVLLGNFREYLSVAYKGGNLIGEPLILPLQWLQIFRPFLWETHNMFSVYQAFENLLVLLIIVYLLFKSFGSLKSTFYYSFANRFLIFWIFLHWFLFSFSSNLGDLSRRKIYFIPFLILLLVGAIKSKKNEVVIGPSK